MFVVRYLLFRGKEIGLASSGRHERGAIFRGSQISNTCHAFHPRT